MVEETPPSHAHIELVDSVSTDDHPATDIKHQDKNHLHDEVVIEDLIDVAHVGRPASQIKKFKKEQARSPRPVYEEFSEKSNITETK